jgi:hypothetical protein
MIPQERFQHPHTVIHTRTNNLRLTHSLGNSMKCSSNRSIVTSTSTGHLSKILQQETTDKQQK